MNKITEIIMRDVGNAELTDEELREIDEEARMILPPEGKWGHDEY